MHRCIYIYIYTTVCVYIYIYSVYLWRRKAPCRVTHWLFKLWQEDQICYGCPAEFLEAALSERLSDPKSTRHGAGRCGSWQATSSTWRRHCNRPWSLGCGRRAVHTRSRVAVPRCTMRRAVVEHKPKIAEELWRPWRPTSAGHFQALQRWRAE